MRERAHDRLHPRLKGYDYGRAGAYFVTICAAKRAPVFSTIRTDRPDGLEERTVGRDALIAPLVELTDIGRLTEKHIKGTEFAYQNVKIPNYVIMPDHIHLLIVIEAAGPMGASGPTLPQIIKAFKHLVTRELGYSVWQTSYHDHIIRNDEDYLAHWAYIDANPAHWTEDEYYFN